MTQTVQFDKKETLATIAAVGSGENLDDEMKGQGLKATGTLIAKVDDISKPAVKNTATVPVGTKTKHPPLMLTFKKA